MAERMVKNTYRALLTCGQRGCVVYCVDAETNEYFKRLGMDKVFVTEPLSEIETLICEIILTGGRKGSLDEQGAQADAMVVNLLCLCDVRRRSASLMCLPVGLLGQWSVTNVSRFLATVLTAFQCCGHDSK